MSQAEARETGRVSTRQGESGSAAYGRLSEEEREAPRSVSIQRGENEVVAEALLPDGRGKGVPPGASVASCIFNLTNTIVGAGILGLPKAFANVGLGLGCGCLAAFAALSGFGLHLLAASAGLTSGEASFRTVAVAAAPQFASLIDAAVAIKCFWVATSYLIVVGDAVPAVVGPGAGLFSERSTWILAATALVTPLALLERLDGLRFTSALSLAFVAFLATVVVCERFSRERSGDLDLARMDLAAAKDLPIFVFGYTCHQNIFAIVNEIAAPRRVDAVIAASVLIAAAVYLAVAASGYLTFGSAVQGDILDNYGDSPAVSAARVFVALLVALSYPLQCHPSRACAISLLDHLPSRSSSPGRSRRLPRSPRARLVLVTLLFLAASLLIALSVKSLSSVLAVVGATGSTAVSYILPGGIYFALGPPGLKRRLALGLFLFGVCLVPCALTLIFLHTAS